MRQALGRGIDALISKAQEPAEELKAKSVRKIPVNKIRPNRFQPRQIFNESSLKELSQSIRKHGLTQPIVVSHDREKDVYEIITGERRLRASELAGLKEIDAIIHSQLKNETRLTLSLMENIQREDLNAIDQALAYRRLTAEFNITQQDLADYCGKSKAAISNTLRLLELEIDIRRAVQSGVLSEGHARALLAVPDRPGRIRLFHAAVERKMSVREIEDAAKSLSGGQKGSKRGGRSKSAKSPEITDMESNLQKLLGTRVEIRPGAQPRKGTLLIHYYTLEDLDRIVAIFRKSGS